MSIQNIQNKLKQVWLNIKNITASGLVVLLFAATIIGIVTLIPVILAVVAALILVGIFKLTYDYRTKMKK